MLQGCGWQSVAKGDQKQQEQWPIPEKRGSFAR
jgi:hypothetical protein